MLAGKKIVNVLPKKKNYVTQVCVCNIDREYKYSYVNFHY